MKFEIGHMRFITLFFLIATLTFTGCHRSEVETRGPKIATATSYLEAAARDLAGDNLSVVRLAEPGTCPGHFDIRPSQVAELRQCRVLLRFDFQNSLDTKITGTDTNQTRVAQIVLHGGMCQPNSYLTVCRQVADHLVAFDLLNRTNADARLQAISARLSALSQDVTNRVARAGVTGSPVIASGHQRDFCEWLGLKVVSVFRAADTSSISEIEEAINAGRLSQIKLIVANLPEGRRTADALAERLNARVVVFENFPALHNGQVSFDKMLIANVEALLKIENP